MLGVVDLLSGFVDELDRFRLRVAEPGLLPGVLALGSAALDLDIDALTASSDALVGRDSEAWLGEFSCDHSDLFKWGFGRCSSFGP